MVGKGSFDYPPLMLYNPTSAYLRLMLKSGDLFRCCKKFDIIYEVGLR